MQDFDKKIKRAGIDFFDRISFLRNIHDKFANHYNQNKIGAFADLIEIRSELVQRSTIKLDQDERRLNKLKSLFKEVKEKIEKHKKGTLNDEIKMNLDQWNEFFIAGNQLFDLKTELMEMTKLDSDRDHKNDLLRYVTLSNKFHGGICNFLGKEHNKNDAYNGYKLIEDIKKLHLNLVALDTICKIIIDQGYPTNIFTWKELSKAEQEEIRKKAFNSFDLQKNNYWETAYTIYDKDDSKTWEDVWIEIEKMRDDNGIVERYATFASFKRNKVKYDKKRSTGKKVTFGTP